MYINNFFPQTNHISFEKRQPLSAETKAKISAALTGIKRSAETRAKVSKAMKKVRQEHPEITSLHKSALSLAWDYSPDIKKEMHNFFTQQSIPTKKVIVKKLAHVKLSPDEQIIDKTFLKKFRATFPECAEKFKKALQEAYKLLRKK